MVDPDGASAAAGYPGEEQIWVVLAGAGVLEHRAEELRLRQDDFLYLPPGVRHRVVNSSTAPCRILIAGYRTAADQADSERIQRADIGEVPKQVVDGHPPSTLYQLLMGDVHSTRDRIAAARMLTSLFVMEFTSQGTNRPHRHFGEEEIYLVLNGRGDMVVGSGAGGEEIRRPAKAGDAFLFRPGCLVGFYSTTPAAEGKARILALRSRAPR